MALPDPKQVDLFSELNLNFLTTRMTQLREQHFLYAVALQKQTKERLRDAFFFSIIFSLFLILLFLLFCGRIKLLEAVVAKDGQELRQVEEMLASASSNSEIIKANMKQIMNFNELLTKRADLLLTTLRALQNRSISGPERKFLNEVSEKNKRKEELKGKLEDVRSSLALFFSLGSKCVSVCS
jgi:hypothetical protein